MQYYQSDYTVEDNSKANTQLTILFLRLSWIRVTGRITGRWWCAALTWRLIHCLLRTLSLCFLFCFTTSWPLRVKIELYIHIYTYLWILATGRPAASDFRGWGWLKHAKIFLDFVVNTLLVTSAYTDRVQSLWYINAKWCFTRGASWHIKIFFYLFITFFWTRIWVRCEIRLVRSLFPWSSLSFGVLQNIRQPCISKH